MNGVGIVTEPSSLLDRVRASRGSRYGMGEPMDAGRQIDTGGLSAAGFGASPIAQGGYGQSSQHPGSQARRITDGYDPAIPNAANGATMAPARLAQRINPVSYNRGGTRKPIEVGGP